MISGRWILKVLMVFSCIFCRTKCLDLNEAGGVYNSNHTLHYRDGPYKVTKNIMVQPGANLTIEQGVKMYFDPGIGIEVMGVLNVAGDYLTRIQFLPRKIPSLTEHENGNYPNLRLVDGPSTRQGRFQVFYRNKWRAVCTMSTNWTDVDYKTACNSMGFSGGGFWKWYRRNNDTAPFVMPKPGCPTDGNNLSNCFNWTESKFMLAENLCQGEDDVGLMCWGPPSFQGWQFHWRGIRFIDAPWTYIHSDPDNISLQKRSLSSLNHLDLFYAGYDNETLNSTAAIWVRGVPPFMNYLSVQYSARDGIRVLDSHGPVEITNSSFSFNRGHGIVVENTTDGRVFINETKVEYNYGDGVQYSPKYGVVYYSPNGQLTNSFITESLETPEVNICNDHTISTKYYPHIIAAYLTNGTQILTANETFFCFVKLGLPARLPYTYTIQFLEMTNWNPPNLGTSSYIYICDTPQDQCKYPRYKIPVYNKIMPPSVEAQNTGSGLWIGLRHEGAPNDVVFGDVRVVLKVHASVQDQVIYGLNVTNSRITNNFGKGIFIQNVRDRTVINNVTILNNQYIGLHVLGGVGDIWSNNSYIDGSFSDGVNISYAGGSTVINGTSISNNRWRGIAFHYNDSGPYMPIRQEIVIKGRPSSGPDYKQTYINFNKWGGILVGNFCQNAYYPIPNPKVVVTYVNMTGNEYHPAFEYHSCRRPDQPLTFVELSGSVCQWSTGFCVRIQPAVNIRAFIHDNIFNQNSRAALIIRNKEFPLLSDLPASVSITRNQFKFNTGNFIVNIGLNDRSPVQNMTFSEQNEIRENLVFNPFVFLNPRNFPYAALVVSSSNVLLRRNCFYNQKAEYEIATDLDEHAQIIDAKENNWGSSDFEKFMPKIFDHFKRYNLALIDVDPVSAICNAQVPRLTPLLNYFRKFRDLANPYQLGGMIYEPTELPKGTYTILDDLQVVPGAVLTVQPGTTFQFEDSIGLLVQGELLRADSQNLETILFTGAPFEQPKAQNIRVIRDGDVKAPILKGRLEVLVDNQWGVVCNRSWHANLASLACNQLGMIIDREFYETWIYYLPRSSSELPIVMDIIRCEEWETDITKCRHDGVAENIDLSCPDLVGIRCVEPHWAGVRYSLLANPPTVTGQTTIRNLIIEKAGVMDFYTSEFCAALQIDWNFHVFQDLWIRDNWWNGIDIVYNDLVRKPKIYNSFITRNKRHGVRLRSVGLSIENVTITDSDNAGLFYNPVISPKLQRDVYTWLHRTPASANNIMVIPDNSVQEISLSPSLRDQRKFLMARNDACSGGSCTYTLKVVANNIQTGLSGRIGVQIVNRPSNLSDENMIFTDGTTKDWNLLNNMIDFPFVSSYSTMQIQYKKTYGPSSLVVLLFYLDFYQYLDPFIHMRYSNLARNEYAVATMHYSNFTHRDGSQVNRHRREQLWFQKTNFTSNRKAVIWVNGPAQDFSSESPIAKLEYWIDNCSVIFNNGSVIETHRDLYQSANVFFWKIYRSNFYFNDWSGFQIALPDPYNFTIDTNHTVDFSENDIAENKNFEFVLSGYYAWMNFSSNNFTLNQARPGRGLVRITGMEKELIMERNRFELNRGRFMFSYNIFSQSIVKQFVPARMWYNYIEQNYFLNIDQPVVESWPRSYAVGLLGLQKVNISYNNVNNPLLDFELVVGLRGSQLNDKANVSFNYWGPNVRAELAQKIFDFDDWNIYSLADYNPYFVTREKSLNFEWIPTDAQTDSVPYEEPSAEDLKGRLFRSLTLIRKRQKWPEYPFFYKPEVPYRIRKDLTIMPGATLTIEKGVEVHICPNVRILVLGTLIADGSFYEPIRFKPINITENIDFCQPRKFHLNTTQYYTDPSINQTVEILSRAGRKKRDIIDLEFPILYREVPYFHKFDSFLLEANGQSNTESPRIGFLHIYNITTGEMVPICDRQFTTRNAQVVCRELGFEALNAYFWVGPRWNWDPKLHIIKQYSEPRQCFGDEARLSDCDLRLTGNTSLWFCTDPEHFVYVHCGEERSVERKYVGHWGGIFFSAPSLEMAKSNEPSVLRHVEIVGAGKAHNDSSSALTMIYQTVVLDHVNITNSSMHGLQILVPKEGVELTKLNVTFNRGIGLNVLTLSFQSQSTGIADTPAQNVTFPYYLFGLIEMCSVGKEIYVESRILVYYKYDSYPVDCLKYFISSNGQKQIGFRLLQANLYNTGDSTARLDSLMFYEGRIIIEKTKIDTFSYNSTDLGQVIKSKGGTLSVHFKGNAADGIYGFIAEVVVLPAPPDLKPVRQINIRDSRFEYNDRGAIRYASMGETNPDLTMDKCYLDHNGYHVWGNYTTSESAAKFDLHNTQNLMIQSSSFWRNQGGLHISAGSSSASTRLQGAIKNCAFGNNDYLETLKLEGRDYQKIFVLNNYIGKNWCPYYDVVYVNRIICNFTHNTFYNNTGTHILDSNGFRTVANEFQTYYNNFFYDNIALGHGYQYSVDYGYFPEQEGYVFVEQKRKKRDTSFTQNRRIVRQVTVQKDVTSFDWYANVGADTDRYRSTIKVDTNQQQFKENFFNNPLNSFEMTTVNKSINDAFDGPVDCRNNYWGYPGTNAVARGKIRDEEDYSYLLKVDYLPVLESNTSLMDGFCPPGWFQAGIEEWKSFQSCFLLVSGAMPYKGAVKFCRDQDAYMPFFRDGDKRLKEVASKVDAINKKFVLDFERFNAETAYRDVLFWISGVNVPPYQCGVLSSKSGAIGFYNCEDPLPFICEKGPGPYDDPIYLRPAGIIAIVVAIVAVIIIAIILCLWYIKSRRRDKQFFHRKNSLRSSLRSSARLKIEKEKQEKNIIDNDKGKPPPSPDLIAEAYRNLVLGKSVDSISQKSIKGSLNSPDTTSKNTISLSQSKDSLTTQSTTTETVTYKDKKVSPSISYTESAYRTDYTPTASTSYFTNGTKVEKSVGAVTSSFKSPGYASTIASSQSGPSVSVSYRNKGLLKRNDTCSSDCSSASCSTCETESTVSHDPTDSVNGDSSTYRSSFQSGSTKTMSQPSSARTSTMTEDTIADDKSSFYSPIRVPTIKPLSAPSTKGSEPFVNNTPINYSRINGGPVKYWAKDDKRTNGYIGINIQKKPNSSLLRSTGKSQDSLVSDGNSSRNYPSKSMSQLNSTWVPPNLNSFSRSTTFDTTDNKTKPLETAM